MFEPGFDQAAGLRADPRGELGPALVPVASPAQPARAYEWLCTLAASVAAAPGRPAVAVVDATASESTGVAKPSAMGLLQALQDPALAHLGWSAGGTAQADAEWLVMPGALGLRALCGSPPGPAEGAALSRLLAPFAPGVLVLLFAPAFDLAALLKGQRRGTRVLVPVTVGQPPASIDAYGSVKLLYGAGLSPVLAPLPSTGALTAAADTALASIVNTVAGTAQRHLGLQPEVWPAASWGRRAQASAIEPPSPPQRRPVAEFPHMSMNAGRASAAHPPIWS